MEEKEGSGREVGENYLQEGVGCLIHILQRLSDLCNQPMTREAEALLAEIRSFFLKRFAREEAIMRYQNAEDFSVHHQQHELFLQHLDCSVQMARRDNSVCGELCHYLAEWFRFHSDCLDAPLLRFNMDH